MEQKKARQHSGSCYTVNGVAFMAYREQCQQCQQCLQRQQSSSCRLLMFVHKEIVVSTTNLPNQSPTQVDQSWPIARCIQDECNEPTANPVAASKRLQISKTNMLMSRLKTCDPSCVHVATVDQPWLKTTHFQKCMYSDTSANE